MLARYMDESRAIPTATSFRTFTVTNLDARRKQLKEAGHRVSFTHLIAHAIARAATEQMPVMAVHFAEIDGKPHVIDDGGGQPRHRRRRREEGRRTHADGAGDQGRRPADVPAVPRRLQRADRQGARQQAHRRRPPGRERLAHQPGRHRHDRLRPAADERPGHDRRHRLDRLPARPVRDRRHDRRREGDDDDVDVRPSHHPGRRVRPVPAGGRGLSAGRARLLRAGLLRPRRRDRRRAPRSHADHGRRAGARRDDRAARRRRGRAGPPAAAGGPGRDVADQGPPHARPPRGAARSARLRARGRPRARSRAAEPDARDHGQDPGLDPARRRARRDAGRRHPAPARDLLRHDRVRDRAHRLAPPARLAAREDRDRRVPQAAQRRGERRAAAPADPGRLARALHAQGLPGPEAVLDRGPRHDGPDARRDDPARGRRGRARGRHRHGPPRPPERARAQPRPRVRDDLPRVRGRVLDRGRDHDPAGRHRRRQVPPRRPGHLPVRRRAERARAAGVQPVAPRVRRSRRRGRHARRPDLAPGHARDAGHERRRADHPARRRRLPRPGRRRGDVQPAGARRLHRRRRAAPDHEQPGRLHHRPGRLALHALGLGPREGLRRPDLPRQRRRRRGVRLRRPAGVRVPPGVRPRRPDRPDRLPPLRPQRGRRARVHAAGDDGQDQGQEAGARAVRGGSWSPTGTLTQEEADAIATRRSGTTSRAATRSSRSSSRAPARSSPPAATSSTARPRPRSRPRSRPSVCRRSTRSCCGSPRASRSTRS